MGIYANGEQSRTIHVQQSSQPFAAPPGSESGIPQAPKPVSSTDSLRPVLGAARTIDEFLKTEARHSHLDDTASRRVLPFF